MDLGYLLIIGLMIFFTALFAFIMMFSSKFLYKKASFYNPKQHKKHLAVFNKNSPTLQFIIAVNSINNLTDRIFNLGTGTAPKDMQVYLKDYWGISNKQELLNSVYHFLYLGTHQKYKNHIDLYITHKNPSKGNISKSLLELLQKGHKQFSDLGIIGYDLCIATNLASWGLSAGYLNHEECLDICFEAASAIQKHFHSWDELMANSLLGMEFSNLALASDFNIGARQFHYKSRKEQTSLYSVPWNIPLVLDNEIIHLSKQCMQELSKPFILSRDLVLKIFLTFSFIVIILQAIYNWTK